MVSTMVFNEDLVSLCIIQNKLMWTYRLNEDSDQDGSSNYLDYIVVPFLEQVLEPFRWNDVLTTLNVYANVHSSRQCDDEGYIIVYTSSD